MSKNKNLRRQFLKQAAVSLPLFGASVAFAAHHKKKKKTEAKKQETGASAKGKLVTDIPANAGLLTGLQYVNVSKKPKQNCANCKLYTAGKDGMGACTILPNGLVAEKGWCVTWQAKGA